MRTIPIGVLLLAALGGSVAVGDDAAGVPLTTGLEELVEVRLVLIDVVVHDRKGDPVSGLEADDFDVKIGGRRVQLVSFDAFCDADAATGPAATAEPLAPPPGRIVLVFDYDHMHNAAETIEHAERVLREAPAGAPHMIVTIAEHLRIEQGFDADPERSLATLGRMKSDPTLWASNSGRLTEKRFFHRMLTLFDLLQQQPGRTTVVLFSGPFENDGFTYDTYMDRIAARAARTRTAFYTIDSGGLRTLLDPGVRRLGGPAMLRRLAHATGGRPSSDTNDLAIAYERAAGALRCSYTLGFHDPRPQLDRRRRVRVNVWRPGHRVAHPASYLERSARRARISMTDSALVAPELFPGDGLEARIELLDGSDERRRIELAASFPTVAPEDGSRRVRATVRNARGTTIRRVRLSEGEASGESWQGRATVKLRPGDYELRLVLSDTSLDEPRAIRMPFTVR